jgi:hypothetical protein
VWLGVGISDDDFDGDDPPSVALAASVTAARAGEVVQLVAAASDDFGVSHVVFYRLDPAGGATMLARDTAAPYALDVVMPVAAMSEVRFFAQAVDEVGHASDSAVVSVTVLP